MRRAGRLHPVPEAHYLYDEAEKILERLGSAERVLKSMRDLERGVLRVVTMPGPSVFLLPQLIAGFVKGSANDLLRCAFHEVSPSRLLQAFEDPGTNVV